METAAFLACFQEKKPKRALPLEAAKAEEL